VKDFISWKGKPPALYRVLISKLGLVFVIRKTEANLAKLEEFRKAKKLRKKDIKIK